MLPLLLAALAASDTPASSRPGFFRHPALRGDTLVFAAEGDLWRVEVGGGRASRLTSHPGEESHPRPSPDGSRVAYTGRYEGPAEVGRIAEDPRPVPPAPPYPDRSFEYPR